MKREKILEAIFKAVESANIMLLPDQQLKKTEETTLFGKGGALDSMALVSFIVDVEQILQSEQGLVVQLTSEKAMAQERSPFRTIGSLADFIQSLLNETTS